MVRTTRREERRARAVSREKSSYPEGRVLPLARYKKKHQALPEARFPTPFLPRLPLSGVAPADAELTGGVPRDTAAPTVLPPLAARSPLDKGGLLDMDTALPSSDSPMKLPSPDRKKKKGTAPGPL